MPLASWVYLPDLRLSLRGGEGIVGTRRAVLVLGGLQPVCPLVRTGLRELV